MSMRGSHLFTLVLAGLCGVLLLLAIALQLGWERGYSWLPLESPSAGVGGWRKVEQTPFKLPPEKDFAATTQRPLFNDDRLPTPDEPASPAEPPPPKVALNIDLTGIILTPNVHLAMIHDKSDNRTIALKEGMPMPGKQGGWTLTEIKPRSAIFHEAQGDEVEVELTTAVAGPRVIPPSRGNQARRGRPTPGRFVPGQPMTKAAIRKNREEQLQHRIEKRRKQMREQARRLREQQQKRNQHNQ